MGPGRHPQSTAIFLTAAGSAARFSAARLSDRGNWTMIEKPPNSWLN
jgi:hypothetical protein